MIKNLFFFIILFSSFIYTPVIAQLEKPKVAVVLSGGGAKGIAHIPLLQKLDSLGIVPDLIVGTSMGSVVGGFYAMGYKADSIASISKSANWDELLGGKTSLKDVSAEEKSEFARYLLDFDIVEGKLKTRSALLNDQYLREFFSIHTYPVFDILDFDQLPIPYRSIATDIVNGEEVIIKDGSLGVAMRASMSIPSIFRPVPYEDVLLVDGGVLNNFPVDVAKDWGADIIIGSDVGGGMKPKEELEGITTILFQTTMLVSNKKNPESREMCDILIDHLPNLTYSTADFNQSEAIYNQGVIGTDLQLDKLIALSKELKKYNQKEIKLPEVKSEVVLDTIVYKGISENNLPLVKSRAQIEPHKGYTVHEIVQGINRTMGTTLFNQITTNAIQEEDLLGIEIIGYENSNHQIKTSLHYDTYRSIGLILNYTGRNILGNSSKILVTADVAVQPRFRVQYQKQFGKNKTWWTRSELLGEFLDQKIFIKGNFADDMNFQYFQFDNELNKNLNPLASYVGFGVNFESTYVKPKVDPEVNENVLQLKKYDLNNLEVHAHFVYNKLRTAFFATKGAYFKAYIARSLHAELDLEYSDNSQPRVKGSTNGFTKFSVSYEKRFHFNKKVTGIFSADTHFIFEDSMQNNDVSFTDYGYGSKYFLGGNIKSPRENSFAFPGLHEDELNVNQFMKLSVALQYSPLNKIYITPHLNYASVGFDNFDTYIEDIFSDNNWSDLTETSNMFSLGATASYNSYVGPVHFDVSWINDINKVRVFFSVGLFLNLSD